MDSENITPIQFLNMYQNNPKKETVNERKATDIAENNLKWYYEEGNSYDECYQSALQAMEWKDKQRKQEKQKWIDSACEYLFKNTRFTVLDIKDFKKVMEEL